MIFGLMLILRLYDKSVPGERRKAEELVHSMVDTALQMEGTCTGGIHSPGFC